MSEVRGDVGDRCAGGETGVDIHLGCGLGTRQSLLHAITQEDGSRGPAYAMTFLVEEWPISLAPQPRPLRAPGDYISQHRLLGPREGKRKKKKVKAKHSRNALPAGAGRGAGRPGRAGRGGAGGRSPGALTRPGRGPSMAEPLLRKTFSRLRGREKLPRKKSDAKDRGECGGLSERKRWEPRSASDPQVPGRVRSGTWWVSRERALMQARNMTGSVYAEGHGPLGAAGLRCQSLGSLQGPAGGASPLTGNGASTGRPESGGAGAGWGRTAVLHRHGLSGWRAATEPWRMRDEGHTPAPNRGRAELYLLLQSFPHLRADIAPEAAAAPTVGSPKKPCSVLRQGN